MAVLTPFVRASDGIGPAPGGRSARPARTTAGAARGRGARFAPAHGVGQPWYGRRDRGARAVRPRRAGPETLLRSTPDPGHLPGDRLPQAKAPCHTITAAHTRRPRLPAP